MSNFMKGIDEGLDLRPVAQTILGNIDENRRQKQREFEYQRARRDKDIDSQKLLYRQEELDSFKKNEALKKAQAQAKNIQTLLSGGQHVATGLTPQPSTMPAPQRNKPFNIQNTIQDMLNPQKPAQVAGQSVNQFVPFTDEEKAALMIQSGLTPAQVVERLTPKKEYSQRIENPYESLGLNPRSNQWEKITDYGDKMNPAYKPDYKERELPGKSYIDKTTKKLKTEFGYYDQKSGKWQKDADGKPLLAKPQYEAIDKQGTNGEKLFSDNLTRKYIQKFDEVADWKMRAEAAKKTGGKVLDNNGKVMMAEDAKGNPIEMTADQANRRADQIASQYAEFVKDTGTENFNAWYNGLFNKDKKNPTPEFFWNAVKQGHKTGVLDDMDAQSAREMFRATFHFDALVKYGE